MKRTTSLLLVFILCVFCLVSGCNNEPTDSLSAGTTPTKMVPEYEAIAVPVSRLAENPVTVEIGQTGVTVDLNYLAWPTITKGDNGMLYAAASIRRSHVDPFGATAFFESSDGGATWSEPRIIYDSPVDDRDVGLLYIGNGKMVATFFTIGYNSFLPGRRYQGQWGDCNEAQQQAKIDQWNSYPPGILDAFSGRFVMLSEDYGKTWGDPIRVPFSCPHGPSLMQDGKTLICSTATEGFFFTYISEDYGKTWYLSSALALPELPKGYGYFEPHIIQLSDGSFLAGIRSEKSGAAYESYRIWTMKSADGVEWTEAKEIPNLVGAPPHFLELPSGAVLMTYSYRQNRFGVHGRISYDGGETWSEEPIILSENTSSHNKDLGYPASVVMDDGTIITIYYQAYENDPCSSILYTKWKLTPVD